MCLLERIQDAQCHWNAEGKGDQAAQGTPSGGRSGLAFAQKQKRPAQGL